MIHGYASLGYLPMVCHKIFTMGRKVYCVIWSILDHDAETFNATMHYLDTKPHVFHFESNLQLSYNICCLCYQISCFTLNDLPNYNTFLFICGLWDVYIFGECEIQRHKDTKTKKKEKRKSRVSYSITLKNRFKTNRV